MFQSLAILLLLCNLSFGSYQSRHPESNQAAENVKSAFKQGRIAEQTNLALSIMLLRAQRKLRRDGNHQLADEIAAGWRKWDGYLMRMGRDIGDYKPLSVWLSDIYFKLLAALGEDAMRFFHLDDIQILNYALPVVFRPCDAQWDQTEYGLHFVPFAGVISYWTAWGVCTGASAGIGLLFCGPIGMGAEMIMVRFLAAPLGNGLYRVACGNENPIVPLPHQS